ncbi:type VI secretion system Vgr family protein [Neoroseomonas oryzicola]|nr:type VI secretion system tip protein TssI/VgrG [Neoroseomonas oryzicola]NKE19045.1 type VI secretion system tip protein VgrG [Neoroseomonas oryzicola]
MAYDQSKRILAITTILGPDKVLLTELEGHDELSQPFLFKIRMATEEGPSSVQGLLGTEVTLEFGLPVDPDAPTVGVERRKFRGFIRRISRGFFSVGGMTEWQAEVVPKLWFLSRSANVKIYQDLTTNDIIQQVANKFGISKQLNANARGMTTLDLCVQYRESALDFVSRLMEKEGLFYFHDHTDSTTTLKIVDMNASCPAWALDPVPLHGHRSRGSVWRFDEEYAVQTGKWATRDFDFNGVMTQDNEQPTRFTSSPGMSTDHEVYDYPGAYGEKWMEADTIGLLTTGSGLTRVAIEREEAKYHRRRGASDISLLDPGRRLKLSADGLTDPEVLITSVHHRALDYSHWTDEMWGDRPRQQPFYENEFTCIPQSVPFRPEIRAPRPFVRGPQTAIVVGDGDIHTDKYGRVQVKFHWDRDNASASVWVRVSQGWAGAGFGQIHIPRVGEEVVVDFLEGDPDRPLITGRLYNSNNMPPYSLPANKTQYGIKTNSVDASGSNELRFEDKGGSEQIYVHAQKDLDSVVENNETRHVKVDRKTNIDANETSTIGGNKKTDVTGNFDEKVMGKETRQVFGAVTETFMSGETRTVMSKLQETVTGQLTQTVTGPYNQTVTGPMNITCAAAITVTATAGWTLLAPGGTKTVDNEFFKIGAKDVLQYAMKMTLAVNKMDLIANTAITVGGNTKMDKWTNKIDIYSMGFKKGGVDLEKDEVRIISTQSKIVQAAMHILT